MNRRARVAAICLPLLCAWGLAEPLRAQTGGAIRTVTLSNTLAANEDGATGAILLNIDTANGINFFGHSFQRVYVNNAGSLTFGSALGPESPTDLVQGDGPPPIIAPFLADVDTTGKGSGLVQYGNATIDGFNTFVANYINVGYSTAETDKLNSFQVVLYDRSDTGAGNFDIEFNYNQILWETGDGDGGTDGLGGTSAAVGYYNGLANAVYYQLPGSLINGALINGGPNALVSHSLNSGGVAGRYVFPVRNGVVPAFVSTLTCAPGLLGGSGVGTCTVTLSGVAPAGTATSVALSSSAASVTVPASVTIPAGKTSAAFSATASAVPSNQTATITATLGGISQTAAITLTTAVQTGYIGVFYNSTPPSPCPAALSVLCTVNTNVNTNPNLGDGNPLDGPVFVFVNTSNTDITNGVLTVVGVDFFDVGTIAANSFVRVIPGVSDDGQNHGSDNFFTVTGSINDTSDNFPSLNSTQFKFTGQQGGSQIQSVDVCGVIAAPIFTPACTAATSNDGTVTSPPLNFLGGPGDNDPPCNNCFGPAIVADLTTPAGSGSGSPLSITTTPTLPPVTVLTPGTQTVSASGGAAPYTWTVVGGSLPPGLALASTGTLSGTPTKPGSYTFTVRVTDATGASAVQVESINIAAQPVIVTTPSPLPSGMATVQYPLQVISASGGFAPYTFTVPASSLPAGLTLSPGGAISGTPTVTGTFTFILTATDAAGQTGTKSLSINVRPLSPDLVTFAGSLSFSMAAGAATLPGSQTVQVEATEVTTPISWSTSITPAESWLTVTQGGATPGSFSVALTSAASSLAAAPAPYQTTIVVACTAPSPCAGNSQSIAVSLLVTTVPAELTALTDLLSFTTSSANPQETSQGLTIQNAGGGSLTFAPVTCGQTWCVPGAAPASLAAGASATINVQANPAGLSPGFYFTNLTIVSSAGTITVPVTFLIATSSSLTLNPAGTQLIMPAGGVAANPDTSFAVSVSGTAPVAWTATILPGAPWLNLATTSGSSTGAVPGSVGYSIIQSAAAALSPNVYYGTIRITSTGVVNSPQDFQVVLDVTAAASLQTPNPTPAGMIYITTAGAAAPPAQTDAIYVSSVPAISYQASAATASGGSWLSVSPATGTTSVSSPAQSTISVNPAGLAAGVYQGTVSYSLAAAAVPTVNVTLVVEASGASARQGTAALSLTPSAATACTPTQIVPTQTALVTNFAAPASWPTPLQIQLNDNCGNAITNGQVVATFSNGDAPLALGLVNTSSGLYSGTWTPQKTGSQVTVTARATVPGFAVATEQIAGSVVPNTAPAVFPNGTVHAFTPVTGAPLAPGTWVAIYGSDLATQTLVNSTIPFATNLAGTSVIIGGIQAPLYFVSTGQVNALIPFELPAGQTYQVIVSNNGALSTPQSIQSTTVTPGVANYATGFAEAEHAADSSLITAASPAKPGEYIVLYLVGMGPTTVPVASGDASPSSPLDTTVTPDAPTITLNGQPVSVVLFSGLTPTTVGLYQIDLQVPANAPNGDLTLVVNQPGFQGQPVILPVHN